MALNKVMLMGRLVRDPEVIYSNSGMAITRITVAVDDVKKAGADKAETNFIPCKAFGKTAELIGNYFQKGSRILVSDGKIDVKPYVDKKTNEKKTSFGVIVNSIEFIDSKGSGNGGASRNNSSQFDSFGDEVDF